MQPKPPQEQIVNPTHSFDLADVERYGSIEKALLIKEIRNMQLYKLRTNKSGWVFYSAQAFAEKFPYMKRASIARWLSELIRDGYLEADIRNKKQYDHTKSYRLTNLSTVAHNETSIAHNEQSFGQNEQPIPPHSPPLSTSLSKQSINSVKEEEWQGTAEQRTAWAKACAADRQLLEREQHRKEYKSEGKSKPVLVGALVQGRIGGVFP